MIFYKSCEHSRVWYDMLLVPIHYTRRVQKEIELLNSTLNSRESALRLPSARSVRFWQQTAICLVSLWALVAELYPLNWARAQVVRRISEKVTTKELETAKFAAKFHTSVCVKFCCKIGKNFTETFHLLNQAYEEDCMSRTQCYEWFKRFK